MSDKRHSGSCGWRHSINTTAHERGDLSPCPLTTMAAAKYTAVIEAASSMSGLTVASLAEIKFFFCFYFLSRRVIDVFDLLSTQKIFFVASGSLPRRFGFCFSSKQKRKASSPNTLRLD
jgi:hypothetical protein